MEAWLEAADGVESLHAGVVALQGLADVLGVAVSHAVHVQVAQAAAKHSQDLRQKYRQSFIFYLFSLFFGKK